MAVSTYTISYLVTSAKMFMNMWLLSHLTAGLADDDDDDDAAIASSKAFKASTNASSISGCASREFILASYAAVSVSVYPGNKDDEDEEDDNDGDRADDEPDDDDEEEEDEEDEEEEDGDNNGLSKRRTNTRTKNLLPSCPADEADEAVGAGIVTTPSCSCFLGKAANT
jgi:cobalamin biosynthesis protein CobT